MKVLYPNPTSLQSWLSGNPDINNIAYSMTLYKTDRTLMTCIHMRSDLWAIISIVIT